MAKFRQDLLKVIAPHYAELNQTAEQRGNEMTRILLCMACELTCRRMLLLASKAAAAAAW